MNEKRDIRTIQDYTEKLMETLREKHQDMLKEYKKNEVKVREYDNSLKVES